jgi:hypothetical protein
MQSFSFGTCPDDVIKSACYDQCPEGYHMTIVDQDEWSIIANAVNQGIDSHLEALTERSTFNNGSCLVHPEELHVLLRRLYEIEDEDFVDTAWQLRGAILETLDIEEL